MCPHDGISALIGRDQKFCSLSIHNCEDTARKWPSVSQEEHSHQTLNMPALLALTSLPLELGEIVFVIYATQFMVFSFSSPN